ncbi:MAG: hypothetical protein AABX11_00320 [Nanoarchaeota archaeon]
MDRGDSSCHAYRRTGDNVGICWGKFVERHGRDESILEGLKYHETRGLRCEVISLRQCERHSGVAGAIAGNRYRSQV